MSSLFKSLIQCHCGWKHRYKAFRNINYYICSQYATKGVQHCQQNKIKEDDLIFLIKSQFYLNGVEWVGENEYLKQHIKQINIDTEGNIEINYFKFPKTIWKNNGIYHENINQE